MAGLVDGVVLSISEMSRTAGYLQGLAYGERERSAEFITPATADAIAKRHEDYAENLLRAKDRLLAEYYDLTEAPDGDEP